MQAAYQSIFYTEEFYTKFADFQGVAVYVFPDSQTLQGQVPKDFNIFTEAQKRHNNPVLHIFNTWHSPKLNYTVDKNYIEKRYNLTIDLETWLGKRSDVDQQANFQKLLEIVHKGMCPG